MGIDHKEATRHYRQRMSNNDKCVLPYNHNLCAFHMWNFNITQVKAGWLESHKLNARKTKSLKALFAQGFPGAERAFKLCALLNGLIEALLTSYEIMGGPMRSCKSFSAPDPEGKLLTWGRFQRGCFDHTLFWLFMLSTKG